MNINIGNIQKLCPQIIYMRGELYYLGGHVFDFEVLEQNHSLFTTCRSYVASEQFDDYLTYFNVDKKDNYLTGRCTCAYFQQNNTVCKHLVAAYLFYINEMKLEEDNDSQIDKVIEMYNIFNRAERRRIALELDITFIYDEIGKLPSLEMKIGIDKLYVIREYRRFFNAIHNGITLEFGKKFVMDLKEQYFNKGDSTIINVLNDLYLAADQGYGAFNSNAFFSGKTVKLLNTQFKQIIEALKDRTFNMKILGKEYCNVAIVDEPIEVNFYVKEENEELQISLEDIPFSLNPTNDYFFFKGNIYRGNEEFSNKYMPILYGITDNEDKIIKVDKKEKSKFASKVLPLLKQVGRVELEEKLQEEIIEGKLKVQFYFDKEKNYVTLTLKFNYDIDVINPLEESKNETKEEILLVRDIKKEEEIKALLKEMGFIEDNIRYVLKDEMDILTLQKEGLERLVKVGEVYYSEDFKNIKIYSSSSYSSRISLTEGGLLEFDFKIGDLSREDMVNALKAMRQGKKYYRASDKGFIMLEEEPLIELNTMLDKMNIPLEKLLKGKLNIQKYYSMYLDDKFINSMEEGDIVTNTKYRELISSFKNIKTTDIKLPERLNCTLRKYQEMGYKWLKTLRTYGLGGVLADEMGLGKTIQTIALILAEKEEGKDKPSIVICPTSLIYNWKDEMEKFAPALKVLILYGNKRKREELIGDLLEYDVIITSYPIIRRDIEDLREVDFNLCIIDEAQSIKNYFSQNAQAVKELRADCRFALTGTPIENSLMELWSIFDFVMPGFLLGAASFRECYELPITKDNDKEALRDLTKKVSPFILRRKKKEVLKELPPKIEKKLIVELTEEQKKLYSAYVEQFKKNIEVEIEEKGLNKSKIVVLAALTRLRQLCCDPSTFIENYEGGSGKLDMLYEVLDGCIEEGHKILLFSQFTSVLKNIRSGLETKGVSYMYLDGSVKSQERMAMVNEFNNGDAKVFLISLKAGGAGLNLTSADVVIHFDPWWNPAVEDQATDRAHRIGQENTVEVIKLVSKGTIEEKIYKLQEKKKEIINSIMEEETIGESLISSMTVEEIKELFT